MYRQSDRKRLEAAGVAIAGVLLGTAAAGLAASGSGPGSLALAAGLAVPAAALLVHGRTWSTRVEALVPVRPARRGIRRR
jgi:hypothetical protein